MTTEAIEAPNASQLAQEIAGRLAGDLDARDERIRAQVIEQVEARVEAMGLVETAREMREQLAKRPPQDGHERSGSGILAALDPTRPNPNADGARLDGRFTSFTDYLRAVAVAGRGGARDERLLYVNDAGEVRADISGNQLATGGALVPEQFRSDLLRLGLQPSSIRPRTFQIPMTTSRLGIPKIRDTSHASTVFGGVRAYWTKPGTAITESQPSFERVWLEANGLKLLTDIENEVLADSLPSVEAILVNLWREAIPWYEEQAFLHGEGTGEPLGVLESGALIAVTRAGANAIAVADLAKMEARLLPGSSGRAVYMGSPKTLESLYPLNNGSVQYFHADLSQPIPRTLNGRPFIVNEHLPNLGTQGDLLLVDWFYYLLGDRQSLSIDASPHAKFENDMTVFRGVERLDGQPWLDAPLTPANGGDTLSPFVTIAS